MERNIIMPMTINEPAVKSKALNQEASSLCRKLFPEHFKPPTQGELQNLILLINANGGKENEIRKAGLWWLWIRDLFIENTITKEEQRCLLRIGADAAINNKTIKIISSRSPELLHAQLDNQGDVSLPRSRMAIKKLDRIVTESGMFLPTECVLIFADLAIDNLDNIQRVCNVNEVIVNNINLLKQIATETTENKIEIIQMSKLTNPRFGILETVLGKSGLPKTDIKIPQQSERAILIASQESLESHQNMFGWNKENSFHHSRNLAITMGLVGESLKNRFPEGLLIHNEAFISRGRLNNIFTDPKNPIPVICLRDLLEKKVSKG